MKKIAFFLSMAAGLLWHIPEVKGQLKLPAASSGQQVTQELGIGTIQLKYQRPNMHDRAIFGDLVPFDEVWRTGANNATIMTFSTDVEIEGELLKAGTYGLFTIPTPEKWTMIFNKKSDQWGAYDYDQSDDVLRLDVPVTQLNEPVETFTISFDEVLEQSLQVTLSWEKTKAAFRITVDHRKEIQASIDEAMKGEQKPYFQAAVYYFKNDIDLDTAVAWVKEADRGNDKAPHIKYWKSQILAKAGDRTGAVQAAEEGMAMAEAANNSEYVKLNSEALQAAKQ